MMQTPESWLGWAAGIIDGEGCIRLHRNKRHNRPNDSWTVVVHVANTDITMLHKLCELLGGKIAKQTEPKVAHHKQQWRWHVHATGAISALEKVLPWLVTKRYQAERALLSCLYRGRGKIPSDMKKLESLSLEIAADKRISHRTLQ